MGRDTGKIPFTPMFLIGAVVIGVVLGYALRGRISNLSGLRLRLLWLVAVAILIQFAIFPLFSSRAIFPYATTELHLASYGLLFLFFIVNYQVWALLVIALGSVSNLVVIALNGGRMPSSTHALICAGQPEIAQKLAAESMRGNIVLMSEKTKLNFLGDWLYLPHGVPLATAFSVGDLTIAVGLVILIVWGMRSHA
ncbi:MAG: DUF5317 domain-containing protein [Candidatus Bipolaricaulota bacterium]|nr:DUF5317 domain-containing protein [Candidatus Bipolaricaulota bacterium]